MYLYYPRQKNLVCLSLKAMRHDESNEVALQTIQTPSWQTDHPFITKVKEVITSEKSTTIIMEYVR